MTSKVVGGLQDPSHSMTIEVQVDHRRTLGTFAIAAIAFSAACSSPLGIEGAVGTGGAFGCILMILVGLVLWAIPQVFIVAELATAFSGPHGGAVRWVGEGLGDVAGLAYAMILHVDAVFNVSVFPALVADAVGSLWPFAAGPIASAVIRVAVLCVTLAVIASGDRAIAWSTGWLSSVVLSAYLFFPVVIFATGASLDPSALGPNGVPKNISLFLLINRVVWNMSGWAQVGALASSAKDPAVNYPRGTLLAVLGLLFAYTWPVLWGYAAVPNPELWVPGAFPDIAGAIAPAYGVVLLISAIFSGTSQCIAVLAAHSRLLQVSAATHLVPLPSLIGWQYGPWRVPLSAALTLFIIALPLTLVDVDVLMSLDNGFATMGVGLFVVAFVRLRYSQPHLERLYRVPGGACGAWSAAVLVLIVVAIALYSAANGDESPIYVLPLITATPAVLVIFAGTRKWLNGGSARFFFLDSSNLSNPPLAASALAALHVESFGSDTMQMCPESDSVAKSSTTDPSNSTLQVGPQNVNERSPLLRARAIDLYTKDSHLPFVDADSTPTPCRSELECDNLSASAMITSLSSEATPCLA